MQQCSIYDSSLKFSRGIYGILALLAFLIQNYWLVLILSILMLLGAFSIKLNIAYQFHALISKKLLKDKSQPIQKESGELKFVSGFIGGLLFIDFLVLYFGKFASLAWVLILIISLLYFLACFAGICVASLMYAFFKKIFNK